MRRGLHRIAVVVALSIPGWIAGAAAQTSGTSNATLTRQAGAKATAPVPAGKTVSGVVKSRAADSLTVNTDTGKEWKFAISSSTRVVDKGAEVKTAVVGSKTSVTDLVRPGDVVTVSYDEAGGTMRATSVRVATRYEDRFR
jgi:hypothetical protein